MFALGMLVAIIGCGGGGDEVEVGDTFNTPYGLATVVKEQGEVVALSFPDCTDAMAEAGGGRLVGFDPVADASVPPPPDGIYDGIIEVPEGEWSWNCGG